MKSPLGLALAISFLAVTGGRAAVTEAQRAKEKESYLKKADADVQSWTAKLKSLEESSEKSGSSTRQEFDRQVKHLNENLVHLQKNIDDMRTSKDGTWQRFQRALDEALRDTKSAFQKTQTYLNKTTSKETK